MDHILEADGIPLVRIDDQQEAEKWGLEVGTSRDGTDDKMNGRLEMVGQLEIDGRVERDGRLEMGRIICDGRTILDE